MKSQRRASLFALIVLSLFLAGTLLFPSVSHAGGGGSKPPPLPLNNGETATSDSGATLTNQFGGTSAPTTVTQPNATDSTGLFSNPLGAVCPQDAKMCPNGRVVTRTGPNCTFPACPSGTTATQGADTAVTFSGTPNTLTGTPGTAVGSDSEVFSTGPICSQDAQRCPDGSTLTRIGPFCTLPACPSNTATIPQACTRDAKMCPDGTALGRTAPNCTFPACPTQTAKTLTGSSWAWVKTQLQNSASVTAPTGQKFVLTFNADKTLYSMTDCNRLDGSYIQTGQAMTSGHALTFSSFFSATMMACLNSLEDTYAQHLQLTESYIIEGSTLTLKLKNNQGTMTFTKTATVTNPGGTSSSTTNIGPFKAKEVSAIAIAESLGIDTNHKAVQASIIMAGKDKSAAEIRESLQNFLQLFPLVDIKTASEQAGLGVASPSTIGRAAEALRAMAGYANKASEYAQAHGEMVRYLNTINQSITDIINNSNGGVTSGGVCTQDVKTCSDGSFVSRQAPSCSFPACPIVATSTQTSPYTLPDVKSVASKVENPDQIATDDEYTKFTITLFSGRVHEVKRFTIKYAQFEADIRATGYTGNINALIAMAGSPDRCTQDAKICPDGSAVGRVSPSCQFAACPGTNSNNSNSQPSPGVMSAMQEMMKTLKSMMTSLQNMMSSFFGN